MSVETFEMESHSNHSARAADRDMVISALLKLPEEVQELFRFHFEKGMTHGEIAEETGMPLGTVKTRLRSGLMELRRVVKRLEVSQNPGNA